MLNSFKFTSLLDRRNRLAVIFVYYLFNCIKYKDCDLLKYIYVNVPKINLRIKNYDVFSVDTGSVSPINRMLMICNKTLKQAHIDIFNTNIKELQRI